MDEHDRAFQTLAHRSRSAEASPLRPECRHETSDVEQAKVGHAEEDDDLNLQVMEKTLGVARSLVDTISTGGSVAGWTSCGAKTRIESRHGEVHGRFRRDGGGTMDGEVRGGEGRSTDTASVERQTEPTVRHTTKRRWDSPDGQNIDESYFYSQASMMDSVELMTELFEKYVLEARQKLLARRFDLAKSYLLKATKKGEERKAAYNFPFDEKLDIGINLAEAYVGLGEFDRAECTLKSLRPLAADHPRKLGELHYSISNLHRIEYCRSKDAALLDRLEHSAQYSYRFALNSDVVPQPFLIESAEILIDMFKWKGDDVAARTYRARHPATSSLSTSTASLPTSVGTMSSPPVASASFLAQVQDGDVAMTSSLLELGCHIEQIDEQSGRTPLLIAAKNKNAEMCVLLLTHKANVHAQDRDGRTVLHIALHGSGGEDLIPLLLAHHADPNVADGKCRTPLHYCVEYNKPRAAQSLLSTHAKKEALDMAGETALHLAIRRKRTGLFEILLNAGAVFDRKTMPRPSDDINYLIVQHMMRRMNNDVQSVINRQDSNLTTRSEQSIQTASSKRSLRHRLSPRLFKSASSC